MFEKYCTIDDPNDDNGIICVYKTLNLKFSRHKQYDEETIEQFFRCIDALILINVNFTKNTYCVDKYCKCNDKMAGMVYNTDTLTLYYKYKKYEDMEIIVIYYELVLLLFGDVYDEVCDSCSEGIQSYICRYKGHTFCFNKFTCVMHELTIENVSQFFSIINHLMIGGDEYFESVYSPEALLYHDGNFCYQGFQLLNFHYDDDVSSIQFDRISLS